MVTKTVALALTFTARSKSYGVEPQRDCRNNTVVTKRYIKVSFKSYVDGHCIDGAELVLALTVLNGV